MDEDKKIEALQVVVLILQLALTGLQIIKEKHKKPRKRRKKHKR